MNKEITENEVKLRNLEHAANSLIGYLSGLDENTKICPGYITRLKNHYIKNLDKALSDSKTAEHWNTRAAPTFTQEDVSRVAKAIIEARETLYDTVKNATNSEPTNSNLQARHMRNDLAEFFAKAALDALVR